MKRLGCALLIPVLLFALMAPVRAAEPETKGKSACLMDIETGTVLYEKNAHEPLAPASVTKVMTLLLIMEAIDSGVIGWEDTVTASASAAAKGGSQVYLKEGETMSISDMVKSIAVSSANDCACAMAEHLAGSESAFVEKMNARAKELGMDDTQFVNCTGLDDQPDAASHKTSAHDIALMSRQLLKFHPDIRKFTTIWMDTIRNGQFGLSNTNKLIRFYPGAIGLKTGFTSGAGYCLSAAAEREGMGLIAVVMGSESSQDRFASCKAMLDFGFAGYTLLTPQPETDTPIPVRLGAQSLVKAIPAETGSLLIEKAQKNSVTTEVTLEPELSAPVSKGQKVGLMTIRAGDQVLLQTPMVAETQIPRLSWWELFVRILRSCCAAAE